jgi:thiol-disulfide isomerase/thioredoxin
VNRRGAARAAVVLAVAASIALTGCSNDPLADQYASGSDQGYISGDGSTVELPPAQRTDPVVFEGVDEHGDAISSADYLGSVYVVNFWWAGCAPCRVEAPDLAALSAEYDEVPFLGVNTQDGPDNARSFAERHGIEYPSILDVDDVAVQLAFAGSGMPPNAVPTTLVVDREGRVAGRISGLIRDPSILAAMIDRVLEEG